MIKLLWLSEVAVRVPKVRVRLGIFVEGMITDVSVPVTAIKTNANHVIVGGQSYAWADVFFVICGDGSHLIDWSRVPPSYFDEFTLAQMRAEHKRLHGGCVTINDVVMFTAQPRVKEGFQRLSVGYVKPDAAKRTLRNGWVVYDGGKHVPPSGI